MIELESIHKHLSNTEYMKNHARWRNESRVWTRESNETDHIEQRQYFTNLRSNKEFFAILAYYMDHHNYGPLGIVGTCGLTNIDHTHKTAEFSLMIGIEYRKQGHGTKALKELLKYGFNTLGLNLIFGETFRYPNELGLNPGAKAYEKLGFTHEATLRSRYIKQGMNVNALIYSITKEEFCRS